jgi:hypothetical protein
VNVKPAPEGFVLHEAQAPPPSAPAAAPPVGSRRAMPPPTIEPSPAEKPDDTIEREWPVVVNLLHKPIRNNTGAEVRQVTMREPRAGDINRYGNPCRINSDGEVLIEERKMTYMIAALTNILPPFIEEMDPRDWNSCAYRIRRFFLPEPAAW